jgi:hypothetical protein
MDCILLMIQHTIQSTFSGMDASGHSDSFTAPTVTLSAKP